MRRIPVLPLLAVIAFTFMSWHIAKAHREIPEQSPPLDPSRSPYKTTLAGAGIVEPQSENIAVGAHVPGVVTEVVATVGKKVNKGDILFQIDDRQLQAELASRTAEFESSMAELRRLQRMPRPEDLPVSQATVEKARADLDAQQDLLNRSEELFSRKITTAEDVVQHRQSFAAAKAMLSHAEADDARLKSGSWCEDIAVAKARTGRMKVLVDQTQVELDRLKVKAPISGTILKVDVRPGEFVGTPPGQALVVMGDVDVLHVRVDVDEQDLPRFRPGLPGSAFPRGDSGQPLPLSFVRVEPYAQPKKSLTGSGTERVDTRVLQVIYAIRTGDQPIYVGQQLDVYLDSAQR